MTTNPAEGVGIKSIRVSGVASHPVTIKVRVFGPMNYGVRILRRGWMWAASDKRKDMIHETETKASWKIHSMAKEESCRRLEDDVVIIE